MTVYEEAGRLRHEWEQTLHQLAESRGEARVRADRAEQEAYDRLIDFIETNRLNYTEFDPREESR